MRWIALLLVLCAAPLFAGQHHWIEAHLTHVGSETVNGGTAVIPIGTALYGVPIDTQFTYYRFDTPTMNYILASRNKGPLDVTVNGTTKISIEGQNGFVLDDGGKVRKLKVVQKGAKPEATK